MDVSRLSQSTNSNRSRNTRNFEMKNRDDNNQGRDRWPRMGSAKELTKQGSISSVRQESGTVSTQGHQQTLKRLCKKAWKEFDYFVGVDDTAFVTVKVPVADGFREDTYPIESSEFQRHLRQFGCRNQIEIWSDVKPAITRLIDETLSLETEKLPVVTRAGNDTDGSIWIDLGNDKGQYVHVTKDGWEIKSKSAVKFRRHRGQKPLPLPQRGGSIQSLRPFCNVSDEEWPVLLGYLVFALTRIGPYPVLDIFGQQGSAKSTLAKIVKSLVDPSETDLRSGFHDDQALFIAANKSHVMCFDNVSTLSDQHSDALCLMSTGGSRYDRKLYTNSEEVCLKAHNPVVFTGIEPLVAQGDLVSRCLFLHLPSISDMDRRSEREFWAEWEKVRPEVLGVLLDALVLGLNGPELDEKERMADFETFVTAAEPALGLEPGEFRRAYDQNRNGANSVVLDNSPLTEPIRELAKQGVWKGSPTDLLKTLNELAPDDVKGRPDWPKTVSVLGKKLTRLVPNLRAQGIQVKDGKTSGGRSWTISETEEA